MKTTLKKLLSLVLVLCTMVSCVVFVPAAVSAAESEIPASTAGTNDNTISTGSNFFFKVGANSALANGTKKTLTAAPFVSDGRVYIPVQALTDAGAATPSAGVVTVKGVSCVPLTAIGTAYSGCYGSVSSMKLICISTSITNINEYTNAKQVELMKKFLFATISASGSETTGFYASQVSSTDHPYIMANQSKFDELYTIYTKGSNGQTLTEDEQNQYDYMKQLLTEAKNIYNAYAKLDADGNYESMNTAVNLVRGYQNVIYEMPYIGSNGGYDHDGGRLGAATDNNNRIMKLAFAYQVTRDMNYAKLAYQFAIYMGHWEHWGPGHYLNCADASTPYALAYDWLYDAWTQLENDGAKCTTYWDGSESTTTAVSVAKIEEIIFTHSIVPAMYSEAFASSTSTNIPWKSPSASGGYDVFKRTNNWSAVCTAGIIIPSLALIGSNTSTSNINIDPTVDGTYSASTAWTSYGSSSLYSGRTTYQAYAEHLINHSLWTLCENGLGQYVPDGSYVESNSYWEYGTNSIFTLSAALTSSTGSHYGVLDAWGMDTTAYFALNTMSSDGLGFNYHDSSTTRPLDTSMFMYLADANSLGDTNLAAVRKNNMLGKLGRPASFYDLFFYVSNSETDSVDLGDLQYHMAGIDGYAVRDSWDMDKGTLYGAFLGGLNNATHGQVDSGSFVYYNKGTRYFCDLGTENYNAYDFWEAGGKNYYPVSAEGNNTLFITTPARDGSTIDISTDVNSDDSSKKSFSITGYTFTSDFYGQGLTGGGSITATGSNANGAYAVLDNTSAYTYTYTYNYDYSYKWVGFISRTGSGSKTTTVNAASSAKRAMLLTNNRNTFVIQDEATFNGAQNVAWVAHTLPNVEIALSVDGKTAYLSDGKSAIRVTLLDPDNAGLTFSAMNCTDDNFLLSGTHNYDYSANNGKSANNDYSAYQKLVVKKDGVTSFRMAVVIEEVPLGSSNASDFAVGYSWTNIASWSSSILTGSGSEGTATADKVADITVSPFNSDDLGDTPIIPYADETSAQALYSGYALRAASTASGSEPTVYEAKDFDELVRILSENAGMKLEVKLYASNTTPITINTKCTVDPNGYSLRAVSDDYIIVKKSDGSLNICEGSLTVTWHLRDGSIETETYTNSRVVSYSGNVTESDDIYEVNNGDGTYSYYTTGNAWAKTDGGKQLDSADMIITSDCCHFWQTGIPYTGAFVTVDSYGNVTGHENSTDLLKGATLSGGFARISLTGDITIDGSAFTANGDRTIADGKTMNLYLNGYTLTYSTEVASRHMFTQSNNAAANVYGPGMIRNEAPQARIFYPGDRRTSGDLYVENVDFYAESPVIDHRACTATFKNCDFTIASNTPALGAINRNNAAKATSDYALPKLVIDGCTFNMTAISSNNAVITLMANCEAIITGGTVINAVSNCYVFQLKNDLVATDEAYDGDISNMKAIIGDASYGELQLFTATAGTGYTTPSEAQIYYGEGFVTDASKSNTVGGGKLADSDLKLVHLNANDYILSSSYATVRWTFNGSTVTDYWSDGTVPTAPSGFTAASGKILSFNATAVEAGKTYNLTGSQVDSFGLKINMSLQSDFNLNFYVEKKNGMSFQLNGESISVDNSNVVTIDGVSYYKIAMKGISPATAGQTVTLTVNYGGSSISKSVTAIQYLSAAISAQSKGSAARKMLVNIVKYIDSAYAFSGNDVKRSTEYKAVKNLYNTYKAEATVAVVDRANADTANVNSAIKSAQFYLGDTTEFRFNIKSTYSGSITFSYDGLNASGAYERKTLTIDNATGVEYVTIPMKAYYMLNNITITLGNGSSCTYSLANYYHASAKELGELTNLLNALYAYCETAQIYQNSTNS